MTTRTLLIVLLSTFLFQIAQAQAPAKKKIPRSLKLSSDTVGPNESYLHIRYSNDLASKFTIQSLKLYVNGRVAYHKYSSTEEVGLPKEGLLFRGFSYPGRHDIALQLDLRGNGYGLFSYHEGFKMKLRSKYEILAAPGKVTNLYVTIEDNSLAHDVKEQVKVQYSLTPKAD